MVIRFSNTTARGLLLGGAFCFTLSSPALPQVQSTQTVEHGPTTREVKVERGTVVNVSGNDMILKMEDGSLVAFNDVPESKTVHVDGKELNIYQIQPGMTIEKQTVTSTTPRLVTTVETVTGKVWHVSPPSSVTLTLENGENQRFNIPKDQKFTINGQETDAFKLKKGMVVSVQRVTEVPETIIASEIRHTGTMPPPPPAPKPDLPILIAVSRPVPAPAAAAPAETAAAAPAPKLPKTASQVPLFGLLGILLCAASFTVTGLRKLIA